jgi:shikimate dehydrogenase
LAEGRTRVGGSTHLVGVIGWPVEHSLSPIIHNTAFIALEMDWVYVPLPVAPERLRDALGGLGPLGFAGANVTMPHKTESAEIADVLSDDARTLQAVNTLVVGRAGLTGHNTDAPGFDRFLRRDAGCDPAGRTAMIFGAGGAARACALALARAGIAGLSVAVRETSRARRVLEMLDGFDLDTAAVPFEDAASHPADIIVNATPLGAHGESLPLPAVGGDTLVVDLLYRPGSTPLLQTAREAGAAAFGGLGLLLHQAAISFELWTGQQPPLAAMSAAAMAELT